MTPATGPAPQSGKTDRPRRAALTMVALAAVAGVARDSRTHEAVIVVALAIAVLMAAGRESQSRSIARMKAWDKRQTAKELQRLTARRARSK